MRTYSLRLPRAREGKDEHIETAGTGWFLFDENRHRLPIDTKVGS